MDRTNKINILFIACIGCFFLGYYFGTQEGNEERYFDGYKYAMHNVVEVLAGVDEVRLGNLVINEPNATVSNVAFFVIDPNQIALEGNSENATVMNSYFNSICLEPEPIFKQKTAEERSYENYNKIRL